MKHLILAFGIVLTIVVCVLAYTTDIEVKRLEALAEQSRKDRIESQAKFIVARMEKHAAEMHRMCEEANKSIEAIDIASRELRKIQEEIRLKRIVREAIRDQ